MVCVLFRFIFLLLHMYLLLYLYKLLLHRSHGTNRSLNSDTDIFKVTNVSNHWRKRAYNY